MQVVLHDCQLHKCDKFDLYTFARELLSKQAISIYLINVNILFDELKSKNGWLYSPLQSVKRRTPQSSDIREKDVHIQAEEGKDWSWP